MFAQNCDSKQSSVELRRSDRLTVGLIGTGVIFASLGLGEAVYRLAFLDFDGATDRLPIEMLFGLAFAWMATKLVACRSEFVTADAAGRVGVLPLDGPSIGGVGVDVAAKFAS